MQNIWVFGIVDTSRRPGLGFMQIYSSWPNYNFAATYNYYQGKYTVIHSDDYAMHLQVIHTDTYTCMEYLRNTSYTKLQLANCWMLHSTGLLITLFTSLIRWQMYVESSWNRVKIKFKRMRGVDSNQLPSYLDEFMWFMGRQEQTVLTTLLETLRFSTHV